ncbi:MAG TPA: ABC transporter substrate-binding protein [Thermomicrobiales bacterium]|jgi:sn-glycerol 3-phosphate transport system substrate-binding protein|nr:ABC transporter substrate-binding protein [Thermomicrobiales bacterium]
MPVNLSRRGVIKAAAGASAAGAIALGSKRSTTIAAPNIISRQGSSTEITLWYGLGGNVGERIQDVIADFNAQNNGVVVTGLQQANYDETGQNLTLALQDGTYPDIALMSEIWWFRFYLVNALLPLDDLMSSTGYDADDVVDSLRNEGFRAGQQWWLPVARSTPLMYYNRAMYEAAGLPGPATTYTELAEYAAAIADPGQQIYGIGFPGTGSYSWQFQGHVWAEDGAYSTDDFQVTMNQGGAVKAGEWWQTAVAEGYAGVSQDLANDFAQGYVATASFSTGSLANITALAAETGLDFGTAFLPGEIDGIELTCPTGGSGLGIMANTSPERQAAAFEFLAYWSSPERTTWWSQNTGYMPIRKSAVASPEMQAYFETNPNYRVAVEQLAARTQAQDVARRLVPPGEQIIGAALSEVVLTGAPAQQVFDAAAPALQAECDAVAQQIIALEGDLTSGGGTPAPAAATPVGTPAGTPAATPAAR